VRRAWPLSPDPQVVNITVHGVGDPVRPLDDGESRTWITVDQLDVVLDAAEGRPHVRVTFDDGNVSDVEIGLPRLLERGLVARFFVLAGCLGAPGRLNSDGVRELHRAGMSIGSHGWLHRDWRTLDWERPQALEVQQEIVQARRVLSEVVRADVSQVAIPFGAYDRHVLAALRRSGVTRVYSSDGGWARAGSWLQPRNSVHAEDGAAWARRVMASPPSLPRSARQRAARAVKRRRG
jgi:peptidoglycan/xylan/chitin deacetylase (PgdA/CDA1 family)